MISKIKSGLEGKTILITGSSRAIGAATARLAHSYGANVIIHGKTKSPYLKRLAFEIGARYIFCDVVDEDRIKEKICKLGKIEILVNSAGINISKPFMELTNEDWMETFNVNVLGTVNFSRALIPQMLENGHGKIINLASVKGYSHSAGRAAYASSKAAIINLTSSMAKELAPHILVNAVAPGFTDTEMTEGTMSERVKKQIGQIPLGRMATPKEIAETILFLASDKVKYITGQTLLIDGGYNLLK